MCVYIISNCSLFSRIELLSSTSIAINHQPSTTAAVTEAAIIVIIFLSRRWRRRQQTTSIQNTSFFELQNEWLWLAAHLTDWALAAAWLASYTVFLLLKLTYFRQFFLLSISHTHKYTRKYTHGVEEIPVDPSSYLILNLVKLHRKSLIFDIFALENAFFESFLCFITHSIYIYISSPNIYTYIYEKGS